LFRSTKTTSLPPISFSTLTRLREKSSDDILAEMLHNNFQLKRFLNDKRMRDNYEWILTMTTLVEKVTKCEGSRERMVMIMEQLPDTLYIEGVYNEVRKTDPITDELHFDFIQLFLQISIKFLSMIPHSSDGLTKIFERIELQFTKIKSESPVRITDSIIFHCINQFFFRNSKKPKNYLLMYLNE
jgi:hypothetical protein